MEWKGIWNYVGHLIPGASRSQDNADDEEVFEDVLEEGEVKDTKEDTRLTGENKLKDMERISHPKGEIPSRGLDDRLRDQNDMEAYPMEVIPEDDGEVSLNRKELAGSDEDVSESDDEEEGDGDYEEECDYGEEEEEEESDSEEEGEIEEEEEEKEGGKEGDLDGEDISNSSSSSDYEDSEDFDTEIENNTASESAAGCTTRNSDSETDKNMKKKNGYDADDYNRSKTSVENSSQNDGNNDVKVLEEEDHDEGKNMKQETDSNDGKEQEEVDAKGDNRQGNDEDSEEMGTDLKKVLKIRSAADEEEEVEKGRIKNVVDQTDDEYIDSCPIQSEGELSYIPMITEKIRNKEIVEIGNKTEIVNEGDIGEKPVGEEELEENEDELNETIKACEEEVTDPSINDNESKVGICLEDDAVANEVASCNDDKVIKSIVRANDVAMSDDDFYKGQMNGGTNEVIEEEIEDSVNEVQVREKHDEEINEGEEKSRSDDKKDDENELTKTDTQDTDVSQEEPSLGTNKESEIEKGKTSEKEIESTEQKIRRKGRQNSGGEKRKSYFEGEEFERKSALATMMDKGILEMEILLNPTSSLQFSDIAKKILKEVQDSRSEKGHRSPKSKPKSFHPVNRIKGKDLIEDSIHFLEGYHDQNEAESTSKDSIDVEPIFRKDESCDSFLLKEKDFSLTACSEREFCEALHTSKLTRTSSGFKEEDINQLPSRKTIENQDEPLSSKEKVSEDLYSCIKVPNTSETNILRPRDEDIASEHKTVSKKHSVTFKTDDEIESSNHQSPKNSKSDTTKSSEDSKSETKSPKDSKCETKSPKGSKSETKSLNDSKSDTKSLQNSKSHTKTTKNSKSDTKSLNNSKSDTEGLNDSKSDTKSLNDSKSDTKSLDDSKSDTKSPKGLKSDTKSPKDSKNNTQTPDVMPLTPSPSPSDCTFPSITISDQSPASVSLTEVTSSSLPSAPGTSPSDPAPPRRESLTLKPIDNSLSSSSPPLISSSSCSISDLSLPPPLSMAPEASHPLPTPPHISPPLSTPSDTLSSLPTPPDTSSPSSSSSSFSSPPDTSSSMPAPLDSSPPLPTPPENSPISPRPLENAPSSSFSGESGLSSLPGSLFSPEERLLLHGKILSFQEKLNLKALNSTVGSPFPSPLKGICSPPRSPLRKLPHSPPTRIPDLRSSTVSEGTPPPSFYREKLRPPSSPLQKLSVPSSLPLPVVAGEQGGGSIKPSTMVAGKTLQPDTCDPKRLGEEEGERTYQCSADTGRERVLHERSVDPGACTCKGKQTGSNEVRCDEDANGNVTDITESAKGNESGDCNLSGDDCIAKRKHNDACIYNIIEKVADKKKSLNTSQDSGYTFVSNVTGITETEADVIECDDVTRNTNGGLHTSLGPTKNRSLQNTGLSSSLEVLKNEANENKETENNDDNTEEKKNLENELGKIKGAPENRLDKKSAGKDNHDTENLEGPWSSPQLAKVVQELVVCKNFKMTTAQVKKRQHTISRLDIPTKDRTVVFDSSKLSSKGKTEKSEGVSEMEALETEKASIGSQEDILKGVTKKLKASAGHGKTLSSPDKEKKSVVEVSNSESSRYSQVSEVDGSSIPVAGQRYYSKNPRAESRRLLSHRSKFFGRGHSDISKTDTLSVRGKPKEECKKLPSPRIERLSHSPQLHRSRASPGPKRDTSALQPSPRHSPVRPRHQSSRGPPRSESPKLRSRRGSCSSAGQSAGLNSSRKSSPKLGSKVSSRSGSPKSSSPKSGSPRMSSPRSSKKPCSPKLSKKSPSPRLTSARLVKVVTPQGKNSSQKSPRGSPLSARKKTENLNKQRTGKQNGKKTKSSNGSSRRSSTSSTKGVEDTEDKDTKLQKDDARLQEKIKSDNNDDLYHDSEKMEKVHKNTVATDRTEELDIAQIKVISDEAERTIQHSYGDMNINERDVKNETYDVECMSERGSKQNVHSEISKFFGKVDDKKDNSDQTQRKLEVLSEPTTPTRPFRTMRSEISYIENKSVQDYRQERSFYIASKMSGKLDAEIIQFFENQQQKPREILRNEKLIQEHFKGNSKTERKTMFSSNVSEKSASASDSRIENQESDENTSLEIKANESFTKDISTKVYPLSSKTKEDDMQDSSRKPCKQETVCTIKKEETEDKTEQLPSVGLIDRKNLCKALPESMDLEDKSTCEAVDKAFEDSNGDKMYDNEEIRPLPVKGESTSQEKSEDLSEDAHSVPEKCMKEETDTDVNAGEYEKIDTQGQITSNLKLKIRKNKERTDSEEKKDHSCQDPNVSEIIEFGKEEKRDIDISTYQNETVSVTRRDEMIAKFKQNDAIMIEKMRSIKGSKNERPLEVKYTDSANVESSAKQVRIAVSLPSRDLEKEEETLDDLEKVSLINELIDDALIEEDINDSEKGEEPHSAECQNEVTENICKAGTLVMQMQDSTLNSETERIDNVSRETGKNTVIIGESPIDSAVEFQNIEMITDDGFNQKVSQNNPSHSEMVTEKIMIASFFKDSDQNLSDLESLVDLPIKPKVESSQEERESSVESNVNQVRKITEVKDDSNKQLVHSSHYSSSDADSKNKDSVSFINKKTVAIGKEIHKVVPSTRSDLFKNEDLQQKDSSLFVKILPCFGEMQVKTEHENIDTTSVVRQGLKDGEVSFTELKFVGEAVEQSAQSLDCKAKQEPEVTYANILPKSSRPTPSNNEIKIENVRLGGDSDKGKSPAQKEIKRRIMPSHRRLTKTISDGNFRLLSEAAPEIVDCSASQSSHPPSFKRSQTESEFHKDKLEAAVSDSKASTVSEIFARGVSGKIRAKSRSVENIRLSSLSCVEILNPIDTPSIQKSSSSCRIVGVLKKKDSRENVLDLMSPSHEKDLDSDITESKSVVKKDILKSPVAGFPTNKVFNVDHHKSHKPLSKQNSLVRTATEQIESTLMEQAQSLECLIKESLKLVEVQQDRSSATESHIYENVPEVYRAGVVDISSHFDSEQTKTNTLDEKSKNLVAKVVHIYENLPVPGQSLDPPSGKLKEIVSPKNTETTSTGNNAAGGILKTQHTQEHKPLRKENSALENVSHSERAETKEPSRSPTVIVKPPKISSEPTSPKRSTTEKSPLKRRQQPESESRTEKQKSNYMKQRAVRVGILKKQKSDITGVRLQKLHYFDTELPGERRRSYSIGSEPQKGSKSPKKDRSDEKLSESFETSQVTDTAKLEISELERRCHSSISTSSNSSRSSAIDRILQSCAPCISSNTGSTLDLTVKSAAHPLGGESDTDSSHKAQLLGGPVASKTVSNKNQSMVAQQGICKSAVGKSISSSNVGTSGCSETNSEVTSITQVTQNEEDLTVKSGHSDITLTLEKESKALIKDRDSNLNLGSMETSQALDETSVIGSSESNSVTNDVAIVDIESKASLDVSSDRDGSTSTLQQAETGETDFYSELLDTILSVVDGQDPANAGDSGGLPSKSQAAETMDVNIPPPLNNSNVSKKSQGSIISKFLAEPVYVDQQHERIQEKVEPISPKKEEHRAGASDSDSTASVDSELSEIRRRITERFPPAPREGSQASQESVLASPSAVCPMPNCTACRSQSINSSQPLVFNFDKPMTPTCCEPPRAASLSYVDQAYEGTTREAFVRSTSLPYDPEVYQTEELPCLDGHKCTNATGEDLGKHSPQTLSLTSSYSVQLEVNLQESESLQTEDDQVFLDDKPPQSSPESSQSSPEQENSQKTTVPEDSSPQDDILLESNNKEFQDHSESSSNQLAEELSQLRLENEKLSARNRSLQREVEELRRVKESMVEEDLQLKPQINQMTMELTHAKEALSALKADRKRLKAEKFDLLNQMKQLYATLEDKEKELRDFIRNYEQRMKESDESLRQLAAERDETEREKWNILKHARDESEKVVKLSAQLGMKEAAIKRLQDDLEMVRKQITSVGYCSDAESVRTNGLPTPTASTPTCSPQPVSTPTPTPNGRGSSADSGVRLSSDRDSTASHDGGVGTPKESPSLSPLYATPSSMRGEDRGGESTPTGGPTPSGASLNSSAMSGLASSNASSGGLSRSAEQLCERLAEASDSSKGRGTNTLSRKSNKSGGTWGSISRVFARQKKRAALDASLYDGNGSDKRASWSPSSSLCVSPLTEESYSEKLRLLEEAQHIPLERWKAPTVLAWLEVTLGMPQYGAMCAENVRSGKVLLELSDSELEAGLGISHPMHRKKLRLAIEELREPRLSRFPRISALGHTWVSSEWLPDLGLPQYCDAFANNLVDGRLLEALTKKELEKHLGVHRKFHQASIIHGVHLLRIVRFDRQILAERRRQCENVDCDPIVWTNIRWVKWARSIDLAEYADNLKDSGVHGALVVLESSFTCDTMATALGIPQSKNIIRRHLATELESLVNPARQQLDEQARFAKLERRRQEKLAAGGSLGRSFSRSYGTGLEKAEKDKRRASLRGSLSRALGLRVREEINAAGNGGESSSSGGQSPAVSSRAHPHHPPQARPRSSVMPSGVYIHHETHRRVKSIGDIETITVTPV